MPRPAYIRLLRDSVSLRMAIGTLAVIVIGTAELRDSKIDWQEHARLYDMAPTCFVLMVDDKALVEQYHFGKAIPPEFRVGQGGTPPILGKEMGHVEYTREPMHLVAWDHSRHPYDLLESHLEFVWERGSKPLPDEDPG